MAEKTQVKPTMIYLPVGTHKILKDMAVEERTSVTRLVESAVDKFLSRKRKSNDN